jgi:hypothetical protein
MKEEYGIFDPRGNFVNLLSNCVSDGKLDPIVFDSISAEVDAFFSSDEFKILVNEDNGPELVNTNFPRYTLDESSAGQLFEIMKRHIPRLEKNPEQLKAALNSVVNFAVITYGQESGKPLEMQSPSMLRACGQVISDFFGAVFAAVKQHYFGKREDKDKTHSFGKLFKEKLGEIKSRRKEMTEESFKKDGVEHRKAIGPKVKGAISEAKKRNTYNNRSW